MKTLILLLASFATITASAQKSKGNTTTPKSTIAIESSYQCPMHPGIVSNKQGKCTKCNMDLTLSKKEQMKREAVKIYTCPMHTEVVSDKSGICPICNGNLTLTKKEQMKMEAQNTYTCPMHTEVVDKNNGKCPICGMALTQTKREAKSKKG